MEETTRLDRARLYGFDFQEEVVYKVNAQADSGEDDGYEAADSINATEAFTEFIGMTADVDAGVDAGVDADIETIQAAFDEQVTGFEDVADTTDTELHAFRPPIQPVPPLRPGPEPIRPPVHPIPPVHPGPEPIRPPILRPPVQPVPPLRPTPAPIPPVHPHPMPTPPPILRPPTGSGSAPRLAPPAFVPQITPALRLVEPGAIANCLYSFTYLWLTNRNQFWFFPTFVGRRSIAGYRWIHGSWVFMGFDLRLIDSFFCSRR